MILAMGKPFDRVVSGKFMKIYEKVLKIPLDGAHGGDIRLGSLDQVTMIDFN